MVFHVLTLFPELFNSYFNTSILGRAQKNKTFSVQAYQLRNFSNDKKHHKVDDKPYGGGPGMVLQIQPIHAAVQSLKLKVIKNNTRTKKKPKIRTILFSTRGKLFTQQEAKRLTKYDHVIFICGHYEGVDERVAQHIADEELSVGNVVLTGGEIPAMMVIDAVSRFIPGVLGKTESLEDIKGSYPTYTRPEVYYPDSKNKKKSWRVPKDLLSGDHKRIEQWRNTK